MGHSTMKTLKKDLEAELTETTSILEVLKILGCSEDMTSDLEDKAYTLRKRIDGMSMKISRSK
jgi:hypothetical protein